MAGGNNPFKRLRPRHIIFGWWSALGSTAPHREIFAKTAVGQLNIRYIEANYSANIH